MNSDWTNTMKLYEPIAIALATVLVLASVFMLGKHTGYTEAIAASNAQLGITDTRKEVGMLGTQVARGSAALTRN